MSSHVQTKKFATAKNAAAWVNRNREVNVLSLAPEDGQQVLLYSRPEDRQEERERKVGECVAHLGSLPEAERKARGFPPALCGQPDILPLAKIVNSVRNLRAFEGLSSVETGNWVVAWLQEEGHQLVGEAEAVRDYGTRSRLVVVR